VALNTRQARLLGVKRGTPAISFEEVGFDHENRPVVFTTSILRDDLLRFRLIRRRAGV
jgi:DNA-binding GntR family transcriptional regulator